LNAQQIQSSGNIHSNIENNGLPINTNNFIQIFTGRKMVDFSNSRSKTIIFDLEMYYPNDQKDCRGGSLDFNPDEEGNFIIGGVFAAFSIEQVTEMNFGSNLDYRHFWCETEEGEKKVLEDIYDFIGQAWGSIDKKDPKEADLTLCGVGTSRVDLPSLYIRCLKNQIDSPSKLFSTFFKAKMVDLSDVGIPLVGRNRRVLHPITKWDLAKMFGMAMTTDITFDVRNSFEQKRFDEIKKRTEIEVKQIAQCYWYLSKYALTAKNPWW